MKRIAAYFLVACLMLVGVSAFSEEAVVTEFSFMEEGAASGGIVPFANPVFASYGVGFGTPGGGRLNITFTVNANQTARVLGATSYDVYENAGSGFVLAASNLPGSTTTNSITHSFTRGYAGTSGYQYYVYVWFTCTDQNGVTVPVGFRSPSVTAY